MLADSARALRAARVLFLAPCLALLATLVGFAPAASGSTVDCPAGDLEPSDPATAVHGAKQAPAGWTVDGRGDVRAWVTPAGSWGTALDPKSAMRTTVEVAALPDGAPDTPHVALVSLDVLGVTDDGAGTCELEVTDAATGRSLGSAKVVVNTVVGSPQLAGVSSQEDDSPWTHALDGNPDTMWHTEWKRRKAPRPHTFTLDLGEARTVRGFTYLPRKNRGNGTVDEYAVVLSKDGTNWSEPMTGRFNYSTGDEQTITFPRPVSARYFRFEARSSLGGQDVTSAAGLNVIPPIKAADVAAAAARTDTSVANVRAACCAGSGWEAFSAPGSRVPARCACTRG